MKSRVLVFFILIYLSGLSLFAETYRTGDSIPYFPSGAPMVANKNGSESSCYISKILKATGYSSEVFELQLVSADWVGATVFPLYFTYIVKKGDELTLSETKSIYLGSEKVKLIVKSVSENEIEFEKSGESSYESIEQSEDSL